MWSPDQIVLYEQIRRSEIPCKVRDLCKTETDRFSHFTFYKKYFTFYISQKTKAMNRIFFIIVLFLSVKSIGQSDLNRFFEESGFTGSTTIYDLNKNRWIYTDSLDANRGTLPASTFKIINSCIALEEKVIKDENEKIKWNGTVRMVNGAPMDAWNQNTNLKIAYKNSTVWFHEALAKRIGRQKYTDYLNACYYGNGDLSEKGINFWVYGSFTVTPVNQIQFLEDFYKEKGLPFSLETYSVMKNIMISETTEEYTLRDKTGWTTKDGKDIGWWVGYVETKDNVYFFATRIIKPETDTENIPKFLAARKEITIAILKEIGVI